MSVLQKATAHFREQLDGSLKKLTVPEWDCDIYYYPTVPLKDEASILKLQQEGKVVEALVQSLIVKSRTADGTRMFQNADRVTLMNEVDPKVLIRIAGEINGVDSESLEEVEKN
jgi:hypothetical protein